MSIIYELGGKSSAQKIDVRLKNFPYPPYVDDNLIIDLEEQLLLAFIIFAFAVTATLICKDVVLEKEKKLKVRVSTCIECIIHDGA